MSLTCRVKQLRVQSLAIKHPSLLGSVFAQPPPHANLTICIVCHASISVCVQVDIFMVGSQETGPNSSLWVVLSAVVAVGVLDGLSQGAIFGDAADLPPAYTHVRVCCEWCLRLCWPRISCLKLLCVCASALVHGRQLTAGSSADAQDRSCS